MAALNTAVVRPNPASEAPSDQSGSSRANIAFADAGPAALALPAAVVGRGDHWSAPQHP
ncbi:hypothetical protein OG301_00115 [Streptomyces platensis]|uniref:hypothetical protein n=1 Tax=Streptomyces platensis TaxID=58346 RepID=UPI002ED4B4B1|nr:hypothetical protein OG301_00115 [Streptomyces platensis]